MHVLVVTTQNAQTLEPMIEHRFYGQTREAATRRYETHLSADAFLASCGRTFGDASAFRGTPCISSMRWEVM